MQFITLDEAAKISDAAPQANAAFFNTQLTHIITRLFTVKHKEIKYREYFRINNEGGAGITAIEMYVWDMVGSAKIIGHYADDLPSAGAGARKVTVPVRWIGDSFHWSWMEIQQAQGAGVSLNAMRAEAANRAIEVKLNNIAWGVDEEATDAGLFGLLNNPNIPEAPVVAGAATTTEWSTKTPDEILADINGAFSTINESTFGAHRADTLALPIGQYNLIANTRISALVETTILQYLIRNSPWITDASKIVMTPELSGAGSGGEDVFFVYTDDAETAEFYIPYEKNTPMGTQVDGLAFKTPMVASTGGLDVRYPLAYYKGVGI